MTIVNEGEVMPKGYGTAYRLYNQAAVVCYPVPFHLIVRWARNFYLWMAFPPPTYREMYHGVSAQLRESQERYWQLRNQYDALIELSLRMNNSHESQGSGGSK